MFARLSAFVIWALIAATVVFWGLRFAVRAPVIPPHAVASSDTTVAGADLTRLLGAPPEAAQPVAHVPEASSRFRLLGIVAPKRPHAGEANGVALIAVDGKPPRAFAVGARVDDDLVLQAVSLRTASIGSAAGQKTVVLEIPKLPAAATGTLPPIGTPAAALAPQPVIAPPPSAIVPAPQPLPTPAVGAPAGPVSIERDGGVRAQ